MNLSNKLRELAKELADAELNEADVKQIDEWKKFLIKLKKASSGSWLGYQASVYYKDFDQPSAGSYFSHEWGFQKYFGEANLTEGDWSEYTTDEVENYIFSHIDKNLYDKYRNYLDITREKIEDVKDVLRSYTELPAFNAENSFIASNLSSILGSYNIPTEAQLIERERPKVLPTLDKRAAEGGINVPQHIYPLVTLSLFLTTSYVCKKIAKKVTKMADHLDLLADPQSKNQPRAQTGNRIFIGHGGSKAWLELERFIEKRLKLECDEFNRVPVGGRNVTDRLEEMLNESSFAFLIMTAEDKQLDGTINPRLNVVHEAGLFQARLGFERAIMLFEEGCKEFSNIHGLQHIQFEKDKISKCFDEVRRHLEAAKLVKS